MPLTRDSELKALLASAHHIAIVGYSANPARPSHDIASAMKARGYVIFPVNPALESTPEQPIYKSLSEIPFPIDIVDIFRRAEAVPEVVEEAIHVGARAIWMQLGIVNEEAAQRAESAGLQVVMDRCIKVEARRLLG